MSTSVPRMALVGLAVAGGIATVTLDSPRNRNALSTAMVASLLDALGVALADGSVRVIILTHTGPVFCSGADLKETTAALAGAAAERAESPLAGAAAERAESPLAGAPGVAAGGEPPVSRLGELLELLWHAPKPIVARIAGPARAGGIGLVAAADIAVCTSDATFAFSEVRLGVIPAVISATVLPRLSSRAAAELFLTGSTFDGDRAAAVGLVTTAVPTPSLDAIVDGYVSALVRGAPGALAGAKQLLRRPKSDTFREDLAALTELSIGYFGSPEGTEGMRAFLEKREANWVPRGNQPNGPNSA
jgi:methylglutaconyl-CoA hydratase